MSSGVGMVQLQDALKKLFARWEEVKPYWDDQVRRDFEERYIQPLIDQVRTTMHATDELSRAMQACYHDCRE
jgi:hypothetical protein